AGDTEGLSAGPGCLPGPPVVCNDVKGAEISAGDLSDRITATGLTSIGAAITLGEGNDATQSGARADVLEGGPGDDDLDGGTGNDSLRGGEGNDILRPDFDTDTLTGGDGIDTAVY